MTLLEKWRQGAYETEMDNKQAQLFWGNYFNLEKGIYEQILSTPDEVVTGTVKELADKYGVDLMIMVGYLDGINDSLVNPNPIETMDEDTVVNLGFDKEKLYYNMVGAKADWLYELPQWDALLSAERRKELYLNLENHLEVEGYGQSWKNIPVILGEGLENLSLSKNIPKVREFANKYGIYFDDPNDILYLDRYSLENEFLSKLGREFNITNPHMDNIDNYPKAM